MSLYNDIRGALAAQLATVSGLPEIAPEAVPFRPTVGTAFVDYVLVPLSSRPSTMGTDHLILHEGTFEMGVVYPVNDGIGAAETMVDAIKAVFTADTVLTLNANKVRIRYSERRQALLDSTWMRIPVSVGWFLYTTTY